MPEIGKLTAVFDANTAKYDAAVKHLEAENKSLQTSFTSLSSGTGDFSNALGTVAPRITSFVGTASGAAGPLSLLAIGMAANATAAIQLHTALLDLAVSTAEWQGALTDLSQQTGVAVETLSAFEILARQTGGSLEGIVASLGIFQKNLEASTDGTSKQAEALNELGVTTLETEVALRQTLSALAKMPTGFHQTALALELFGRGGKQMLAILKETNGDIDSAMAKFRAMGLEVSGPTAAAADKLNDKMVILDAQTRALKASLGVMIAPAVLSTVESLTKFINDNELAIGQLASGVGLLASYLGGQLVSSIYAANTALAAMQGFLAPLVDTIQFIKGLSGESGNIPALGLPSLSRVDTTGIDRSIAGAGIFRAKGAKGTGGGGRAGGGKSAAETQLERETALLKSLNKELASVMAAETGVDTSTRSFAVSQELLNGELEKAGPAFRSMAQYIADQITATEKRVQGLKDFTAFQEQQNEAVREALHGEKSYIDVAQEAMDKAHASGVVIGGLTNHWTLMNAQILASVKALQMYSDTLDPIMLKGDAVAGIGEDAIARAAGAAADVAAGTPPINIHQITLDIREQMRQLAFDLTDLFDRSITDGFNRGIQSGLLTLGQGLLRIVEEVFLKKLATGLADLLGGIATGGGGGSFWGGLVKSLGIGALGGIGGGIGGGGSKGGVSFGSAGKFATGLDYVPYDNFPALLHKGERVMTAEENKHGSQVVNHYTIQLPPVPRGGYVSPKSARQQADLILAALRGST